MNHPTNLKRIAAFLLTAFLISCGGQSEKAKEDKTPADTATAAISPETTAAIPKEVKLICKELGEDSMSIPHFNVALVVDGKETIIKNINGCASFSKADYKNHDIPAEAVSACGGWYAGAGDYYYVIMVNGKPVVFEGWQEEGQDEKGFHWKEITVN